MYKKELNHKEQKDKERAGKGTSSFFIELLVEKLNHQQLYIKYFNMRQVKYQV